MQAPGMRISKSQATDREYDKYVNLSIQWNRWLLKPMGVWPRSLFDSATEKYLTWLINAICYGLISFLFIPSTLYTIVDVKDLYNRIKMCGPLSFCVMAYLKYYSLVAHANDIQDCVQRIEWDWRNIEHFEDRSIMVANANFGRQLVKGCTIFMYGGFVFYYIVVPVSIGTLTAEDENLTFVPMVFPISRVLVDSRHSPANEILFAIQLLAGGLIHGIAAAACSLIAAFAVHACGQMKVLMCWLGHLIDGREDMCKTVDGRIASIVTQHTRILKCLSLIEKSASQVSLVEVLGCTLGICLLGYYIIVEWNSNDLAAFTTHSLLLVSYVFNIFIFCYIGELVAELCKRIGEISYMIEWYRLPENKRLSIVLIIAMSNATIKLTGGSMVKLCLSSFGDVVKTSVAFLNMLRALT
ncbi:odorant receptor 22c-like [Colletes gigas]|uniref:odorant receptor 22c-like n=1 Tax=Colletes gigas TaxID=935657 RepID=UPI001C9AE14F|nr:odorant receptor 22c-like [Colletes gigas]